MKKGQDKGQCEDPIRVNINLRMVAKVRFRVKVRFKSGSR